MDFPADLPLILFWRQLKQGGLTMTNHQHDDLFRLLESWLSRQRALGQPVTDDDFADALRLAADWSAAETVYVLAGEAAEYGPA